ncbi:MAG: aminotransferase class I/II-fold pyridoxal phosphate-dependent enzyme [Bacteroidota bacterium]
MKKSLQHLETIAIHAGMSDEQPPNSGIVPPLEPSTIFEHRPEGWKEGDWNYTRYSNPNRNQLEQVLAALEGGAEAVTFSSGVAAIGAVFQALPKGAHVLYPEDVYMGTRTLIREYADRWELSFDAVDMTDLDAVEDATQPHTALLWLETPSNPLLHITDVKAITDIAKGKNIAVCADSTWPTPYNLRPLELGADLVMHSTTKYFSGHSDILGGVVTGPPDSEWIARIRTIQQIQGAVPSPRDCWLLTRSIRTFPYRMRAHNEHAQRIAEFLDDHKQVEQVFYPGLSSHKGHEIAKNQMNGFGGMISFLIHGDAERALQVVAQSKLILRATSLGGVESTWEHRKTSEGETSQTPDNLIRLSVGLEHPDDLIQDLREALN